MRTQGDDNHEGVGGFASLANHAQAQVEASALLGHQLWWDLCGNRISHASLEAHAQAQGLPLEYLPSEVQPSGAFRRAWRAIANRVGEGLLLREIGETKEAILVALARESVSEQAKSWAGDQLATIVFDKKSHAITIEIDPIHGHAIPADFERNLRKVVAYHSEHTTQDVRAMITRFASKRGIMLKAGGGIYFVPQAHTAQLEALCRVVAACSAGNATYTLPVADSAQARATMSAVAQDGLAEEIRQLEAEIASFDLTKARESTLAGKIDAFDSMRARVSMFASVLNLKAGDLTTRLDSLRARISHVLAGGDPETAPAVEVAAKPKEPEVFDVEAGF